MKEPDLNLRRAHTQFGPGTGRQAGRPSMPAERLRNQWLESERKNELSFDDVLITAAARAFDSACSLDQWTNGEGRPVPFSAMNVRLNRGIDPKKPGPR